jgi:aryl-alcohol dehydrogenase-like predicted oxidoreductase
MEYMILGKSDLYVSRIALGTWAIGGKGWGNVDEKSAARAIDAAIDGGINFIDTAPYYGFGKSEEVVGEAVKNRRDKVILATKCGLSLAPMPVRDLSPEAMEKELDDSLRRLGTDYIDLYQCHWPDPKTPIEKTMAALMKFKEQGKIRHIGLCNFSNAQLLAALEYGDVISLQAQYSLLERSVEEKIRATCQENNISLLPYGPLGGGVLTGKYPERPRFSMRDARSFFYKYYSEKNWPPVAVLLDEMRQIAEPLGATPAALAISWLLSRPTVASVIAGARTPAQAAGNIEAGSLRLSESDLEALGALSDTAVGILGNTGHHNG